MKAKSKKEIFFVKETPDNYDIDLAKSREISKTELGRLLKESRKRGKVKKAL